MQKTQTTRHKSVSYAKYGYMFIAPFFLAYAFFMIYPLINTFILSLKGNGSAVDDFVGLQNYQFLLFGEEGQFSAGYVIHKEFMDSFYNTIILWVGNFVVQIVLSLLLAVWFSDVRIKVKGTGFFKVVMYLPNIITASSVAGMFLMLFGNSKFGAVNSLLINMDWIKDAIPFINGPWSSRVLVMLIQSWMWFGNTTLLLMSGIFGIDPAIYEAASIDGSSGMHTFFKITMPILKPIFIYVFITSMIGGLQMFDIPYLLHEGTTIRPSLETAAVFIYKYFHQISPNYGYSAAASVILFIITGVLGMIIYKFNTDSTAPVKRKKAK
ncbi:MAG: sugar ABC transporter permease [Ruminococcaceae bacterium]|nr:sugar ABC transporter permease [Oscillospiraceae bacterium]